MTARASIFEEDEDVDVDGFRPVEAPRPRDPAVIAAIRETAEAKGFASRGPVRPTPPATSSPSASAAPSQPAVAQEARLRRRRTGRDRQLNVKVTDDCLSRFYAIADAQGWGLGETLEEALAALEAALTAAGRP
ncbi:hypothetical protein [Phenylobacterium sp. CCH12-B4]|uniref:hypothetical protein n=1 Tax=Phenylobacterium sp. CCH12-B4 TaxID=1768784 RepID=UPI00083A6B54|nr:hypothetical protein [Phenylobacterium sp. CCH12-B4]